MSAQYDPERIRRQIRVIRVEQIAIFDRAICKLDVLEIAPLIENADFLSALEDYDIQLTTPP